MLPIVLQTAVGSAEEYVMPGCSFCQSLAHSMNFLSERTPVALCYFQQSHLSFQKLIKLNPMQMLSVHISIPIVLR